MTGRPWARALAPRRSLRIIRRAERIQNAVPVRTVRHRRRSSHLPRFQNPGRSVPRLYRHDGRSGLDQRTRCCTPHERDPGRIADREGGSGPVADGGRVGRTGDASVEQVGPSITSCLNPNKRTSTLPRAIRSASISPATRPPSGRGADAKRMNRLAKISPAAGRPDLLGVPDPHRQDVPLDGGASANTADLRGDRRMLSRGAEPATRRAWWCP